MITIAINENRIASTLGRCFCGDANTQIVVDGVPADGLRVALIDPERKVLALCNTFTASGTNAVGVIALNTQELADALKDVPTGRIQRVAFIVYNASGTLGSGFVPVVAEPLPSEITPIPPSETYLTANALAEALQAVSAPEGDNATQANIRNALNALIEALKGIGVMIMLLATTTFAEPMRWDSVPPSTPVETNNLTADLSQYWIQGQTLTQSLILDDWVGIKDKSSQQEFFYTPTDDGWVANLFIGTFGFLSYADAYSIRFQGWDGQQTTLADFVINPWQTGRDYSRTTEAVVRYSPAVLTITIPEDATLVVDTNGWRDGLAVFTRIQANGVYSVSPNIKLLGYGSYPTNNATAVFYRDGDNVFCNVLTEY